MFRASLCFICCFLFSTSSRLVCVSDVTMKDIQSNDLFMEIYDMRGVLIANQKIANTYDQIDISKLASGTYRVRVVGTDVEWNDKVVVVK